MADAAGGPPGRPAPPPAMFCCAEFESAFRITHINPIDGPTGWLVYGTDYESVSMGEPRLRYWPISYCPFCGRRLEAPDAALLRRTRRFGWQEEGSR